MALVSHADDGREQLCQIDRLRFVALHFGVEPAGVRNVGDQPVEPFHVVLNHRQQAAATLVAFGKRQRLHRRAQRSKRVLELVRHVGGESLDRLDAGIERVGHVAQRARQVPDLVAPVAQIGNFHARADTPAHESGAFRQPPNRTGDGSGEQERQHHHHAGGDEEHLEDGDALGAHHVVDVGALRRQHEGAAHGAEALHRYRDRHDDFAAIVDAHHARLEALQCIADLAVGLAVLRTELVIERQRAAAEPGADGDVHPLEHAGFLRRRRQVEAQHIVEIAAVEDERAVAVVDAGAGIGRRHQAAQHRRDPLGIDREFEPRERLLGGAVALAGLQLEQAFGIDGDGVGLHRRGGGDGAGDDFALHQQALDARIDQAGAELGKIENSDHQREQAGDVEKDDAPAQTRKGDANEEVPASQQ